MKLGHIGLPVSDEKKSKVFYDAIAPHVGLDFINEEDGFVGYGKDETYSFYVHTDKPALTGLHLCFAVDTKEKVDAFYKAALAAGGVDNGAPGIRENYSPTYYAAFVLDPDGNNIEAVHRP